MNTVEEIISQLNLKPHPEGGFFAETYRSDELIPENILPERYIGERSFGTCIYYLLTTDTFSAMHRIKSDEIFHFYSGDPVEMLQLYPDGTSKVVILGHDIKNGMNPQVIVSEGVWQGARLVKGGKYALLGTTVSPGFEFEDFEVGIREMLVEAYPEQREMVISLTR